MDEGGVAGGKKRGMKRKRRKGERGGAMDERGVAR